MALDLIYLITAFVATPFLLYRAIRYNKYREGWGARLFGAVPRLDKATNGRKRVWFHAVSVGEVNLLKTIVARVKADRPNYEFVVSATSKTGYDLARKLFESECPVFYCPLDFSWSCARAMRRIQPDALVLVELELWPHLVKYASKIGARVVVINGRIGDESFKRYKLARPFLASTFRRVDLIVANDERAAAYFRALSPCPERVLVSGSIKYDGALRERSNAATRRLGELLQIAPNDVVFLAGSLQSPEESAALATYAALCDEFPQLRLIIVPRHKERFEEVARLLDESGVPVTRRSTLGDAPTGEVDQAGEAQGRKVERVVLVDTIGELGALWGLAEIAFVGGSWGKRGGQNMLEPAGYGAAVSFGPNVRNFKTIAEALVNADAAVVVNSQEEMQAFVRKALESKEYRERLGANARKLVESGQGATERALAPFFALLDE